jgi:hypothetical protein
MGKPGESGDWHTMQNGERLNGDEALPVHGVT